MVLADLGRKINGAIQSMSKASVVDEKAGAPTVYRDDCRVGIVCSRRKLELVAITVI